MGGMGERCMEDGQQGREKAEWEGEKGSLKVRDEGERGKEERRSSTSDECGLMEWGMRGAGR